jgi:hypothetical protein
MASPSSAPVAPVLPTTSVFAGHRWIKIAITHSGFYRLTYSQIRTLVPFSDAPAKVPFSKIYLFSWPGRPVLPENSYCDACDYREVATGIEDFGNDGLMGDNTDALDFYALGPSDWASYYDPTAADTIFINNQYEKANYYFLTYAPQGDPVTEPAFPASPQRIALQDASVSVDGTESVPAGFTARRHLEVDSPSEYYPNLSPTYAQPDPSLNWDKFFWRSLQTGGSLTQIVRTPGADPGQPAQIKVRAWGLANRDDCAQSNPGHLLDVTVYRSDGAPALPTKRVGWFGALPITSRLQPVLDTLTTIQVVVPSIAGCPNRFDQSVLSMMEVFYTHTLTPENDSLHIDSPGNGNAIYNVGPFKDPIPPVAFDVTDPFVPRQLTGMSYQSSGGATPTYTLSFEVNETGPTRYEILPWTRLNKPGAGDVVEASLASLDNLRSDQRVADYLLIYYDGFKEAADTLLNWRTVRLPLDSNSDTYSVAGIPVSALYDQFSGGRVDPTAIRNFLRSAFYNWRMGGHGPPAFVTLLGDASFDFKNLLGLAGSGQPGSLVPSYENGFAIGAQFASDDWLTNVDDPLNVIPDYFAGRIPAPDLTTALDYIRRKLLFYERSAPTGDYRNRLMFIADDDLQGQDDDILHWKHLEQTSELDSVYTPDHIDRDYVYLHTYPDGPGRTKPGAKADIKSGINGEGVFAFNYIGHGSPFKLSDENVLIDTDAGSFSNATQLPLFIAASCDVGKFNDPRVPSLGERMLLATAGGAIAVISATEVAYSDLNVDLDKAMFTQLFDRAAATGQYHTGVGPALLAAKMATSVDGISILNNEKYQLMGDAGMRINLPKLWVEVSLYDSAGITALTEIKGGQTVTYRGRVLTGPGGTAVPFTGIADLLIEDSQPRQTAPDCELSPGCQPRPQYDFRAGAILRGGAKVTGGTFEGQCVVPLEARIGARGKVRAYVQGLPGSPGLDDAAGSIRVQVSPGVPRTDDGEGPTISLSFPGGVTSVRPDATLRVDLSDPSGILTTGHTIQNGIVITLDDNTTARVDITSSFRYAAGSHTSGTAIFVLPNLAVGPHTVKVSAADNLAAGLTALAHRSSASIAFDVVSVPPVQIRSAYLFPNPTESGRRTSGGQFVVDGPGDSVNVLVRLYTVTGRMIRELTSFGGLGQIQIPWDGYDADGYPLANGTYLFKVYVNGRDSRGRSSARQKASTEGRFVILNEK